jgi:predicted DNA binding CopG/RHH family protein
VSIPVNVRLPSKMFDRLTQTAAAHHMTVPQFVRAVIKRAPREPPRDPHKP